MGRRGRNGISTAVDGKAGSLRLHGEVDITAVVLVEHAFSDLVERRVDRIVVDFSDARFLDSKAIEALMRGGQAAQLAGVRVAAAGAGGQVARALDICGLEHAMPLYASRGEALAAI